jgi:hypothetical protein
MPELLSVKYQKRFWVVGEARHFLPLPGVIGLKELIMQLKRQ